MFTSSDYDTILPLPATFDEMLKHNCDFRSTAWLDPRSLPGKQYFLLRRLGFGVRQEGGDSQGFNPPVCIIGGDSHFLPLKNNLIIDALRYWCAVCQHRFNLDESTVLGDRYTRIEIQAWRAHRRLFNVLGRASGRCRITYLGGKNGNHHFEQELAAGCIQLFAWLERQGVGFAAMSPELGRAAA